MFLGIVVCRVLYFLANSFSVNIIPPRSLISPSPSSPVPASAIDYTNNGVNGANLPCKNPSDRYLTTLNAESIDVL